MKSKMSANYIFWDVIFQKNENENLDFLAHRLYFNYSLGQTQVCLLLTLWKWYCTSVL